MTDEIYLTAADSFWRW